MEIEIKVHKDSDSSTFYVEEGLSLKHIFRDKDSSIPDNYAVALKNGKVVDFHQPLTEDVEVQLIPYSDQRAYPAFWHTTSHIMAQAVKRLYSVKLAIGPSIEEGFYYDMEKEEPFSEEDLEKISEEMEKIIEEDYEIKREEVTLEKARELFSDNKFKLELIEEIPGDTVSIYSQGEFKDLCRGPHLPSTGMVKSFKLLSVSGSYWRGDEHRESLQRIYGISYPEKKSLKDYIKRYEEAKKRDHRKIGRELDLFNIYEEVGPGLIVWHPKGTILREVIENFWKKEHLKRDYQLIKTPHIAKSRLWKTSGHFDFYLDNMYVFNSDDEEYVVKPMNCPYHILYYKSDMRSYRDLPIKLAELGTVYRNELSGTLHGTLRVRGFTQDDAHIFCTEYQIKEEIGNTFDFAVYMIKAFGFDEYTVTLSVRDPENKSRYAGSDEEWENAEKALVSNLEERDIDYKREEGEAVFYGPKIDIHLKDALGRKWQGPTIQFDFNIPRRFDITYIGEDGEEHQVYMIHRALLGALERFIGVLIEHYRGNFPVWLAPYQVSILPISDDENEFAGDIESKLKEEGIRTTVDLRNEKLSKKIRDAETQKIPYMFIIGSREVESNKVSVRHHQEGDIGTFEIPEIISKILEEIKNRR